MGTSNIILPPFRKQPDTTTTTTITTTPATDPQNTTNQVVHIRPALDSRLEMCIALAQQKHTVAAR